MPTDPSDAFLLMILDLTPNLIARDKLKLIASLAEQLRDEAENPGKKPFPKVRGIMEGIGPSPSVEDFEEARRAMWEGSARTVVPEDASR